jgi:hypothetical protein
MQLTTKIAGYYISVRVSNGSRATRYRSGTKRVIIDDSCTFEIHNRAYGMVLAGAL